MGMPDEKPLSIIRRDAIVPLWDEGKALLDARYAKILAARPFISKDTFRSELLEIRNGYAQYQTFAGDMSKELNADVQKLQEQIPTLQIQAREGVARVNTSEGMAIRWSNSRG